jgi:hypothetical protein
MKKLIMIFFALVAFSCGDGNRSSERDDNTDNDNTEMAEPDTTHTDIDDGVEPRIDTSSTWDRHRDHLDSSDSLNNKQ